MEFVACGECDEFDPKATFVVSDPDDTFPAVAADLVGTVAVSWIGSVDSMEEPSELQRTAASIAALRPIFVGAYGVAADLMHDLVDRELHASEVAATTLDSTSAWDVPELFFEIFQMTIIDDEFADVWSSRLLIFSRGVPAARRAAVVESLGNVRAMVRNYVDRAE